MSGLVQTTNISVIKSEPSIHTDEHENCEDNMNSQNKSYGDFEEISDDESATSLTNGCDWDQQSCPMWKPDVKQGDRVSQSLDPESYCPLDLRINKDEETRKSSNTQRSLPVFPIWHSIAESTNPTPANQVEITHFKQSYQHALTPRSDLFRNIIPAHSKSTHYKLEKEKRFNAFLSRGFLSANISNPYPSPVSSPGVDLAASPQPKNTNQLHIFPSPTPLDILNSMYTPPPTPSPRVETMLPRKDDRTDKHCHAFTDGTRKQTLITASRKMASLEIDKKPFNGDIKCASLNGSDDHTSDHTNFPHSFPSIKGRELADIVSKGNKNSQQKFVRPWESPLRGNGAQDIRNLASQQANGTKLQTDKQHLAALLQDPYSYKNICDVSHVSRISKSRFNPVFPKPLLRSLGGNTISSIVSPVPSTLLHSTATASAKLYLSSHLPHAQLSYLTPKFEPKEIAPIANARGIKNMLDSVVMANEAIQKIMSTSTTDSLISPGYPPKPRAVRSLKPLASELLGRWYQLNADYPYPTKADVEELARLSGITEIQVKKWMANKRMRTGNTKPAMRSRGARISARTRAALAAARLCEYQGQGNVKTQEKETKAESNETESFAIDKNDQACQK